MKVNTNTQSYVNTRKENESLQHQLNMIQNNKKSNEEMIRNIQSENIMLKQKLSDLQSEQKTNISSDETDANAEKLQRGGGFAINSKCASYLNANEYIEFSTTNRKIYISCNSLFYAPTKLHVQLSDIDINTAPPLQKPYTISQTVNNNPDKIYTKYHDELVPGFINIITTNITKRVDELVYIINENNYLINHNKRFDLNVNEYIQNAMSFIAPLVTQCTIVQLNSCKKIPKNKTEYKKVARNRLNRNKPKFLGNYVFGPLIFNKLYGFCNDNFSNYNDAMIVFVSLLRNILSPQSTIKFDQTRAQPLIPYNTIALGNKFKSSCVTLLKHYNLLIEWENSIIKNKNKTAKDKWDAFINICLPKLAKMVESDARANYTAKTKKKRMLFVMLTARTAILV